jgi:hypothetical protein
MYASCSFRFTRAPVVPALEQLEDRMVPAPVAATVVTPITTPANTLPVLAQAASISFSATATPAQQGAAAPVGTAPGTVVTSGGQTPPLLGTPPNGPPPAVVAGTATEFGVNSLPGGPVNTIAGGIGVLASGAMVTNGAAGLTPGGIISPTAAQQTNSLDALFSVNGLADRVLFPVTIAISGIQEPTLQASLTPSSPAGRAVVQPAAAFAVDGQVLPMEAPATRQTTPAEPVDFPE